MLLLADRAVSLPELHTDARVYKAGNVEHLPVTAQNAVDLRARDAQHAVVLRHDRRHLLRGALMCKALAQLRQAAVVEVDAAHLSHQ